MSDTSIKHEAESQQASSGDGYWDAYQRSILPTEVLAVFAAGAVVCVGIATAITSFV